MTSCCCMTMWCLWFLSENPLPLVVSGLIKREKKQNDEQKNHRVEARAHKPVGGVQAAAPEAVALVAF